MRPDAPRRRFLFDAASLALVAASRNAVADESADARVLRVGPARALRTPARAAEVARDGDVVEIDAGTYEGDVAVWGQRRLTIRAAGGAVVIPAAGRNAEGKGIWVIEDGDFDVEGIEFRGARVPDRNGAGIRFTRGRLRLRKCRFVDNEMGVLTGNDASSELAVDACYFEGPHDRPGGEGLSHNLYAGAIARFTITGSRSVRAQEGHLLKCRAERSVIVGNAFVDGPGGTASYEVDLPNGGHALLRENLIEQGEHTENPVIISFGEEGYRWRFNELILERNTVVNRRADGVFVRVSPGAQRTSAVGNRWVGKGRFEGIDPDRIPKV